MENELAELEYAYCDLHKDVYGVKARWYRAESIEQARADLDALQAAGEVIWAEERAQEERTAVAFEARIADLIKIGAADRAAALRWIHEAEDTGGDNDYLCFRLGLRYGYFGR